MPDRPSPRAAHAQEVSSAMAIYVLALAVVLWLAALAASRPERA